MKLRLFAIIIFSAVIMPTIVTLWQYENHIGLFYQEKKSNEQSIMDNNEYTFEPHFIYRDALDISKSIDNNDSAIKTEFYEKVDGKYKKVKTINEIAWNLKKGDDGYDHPDYSNPINIGFYLKLENKTNPIYLAVTVQKSGIIIAPAITANKDLNPEFINYTFDSVDNSLLKSWIFAINTTKIKQDAFKFTDWTPLPRTYYVMFYPVLNSTTAKLTN